MLDHTKPYFEKMHYIDAELAGHADILHVKLQSLCGIGFSLFTLRVLGKPCHFGVNWPTALSENKDRVHFFTLKFEWHSRYNRLLLCNSENCDIAWFSKNNSEWYFCVFFFKKQKLVSLKKNTKIRFKKTGGLFFFLERRVFLNSDFLSILFVIFPWSRDLEQVTSLSVWLGVRLTPRVKVPGNEEAE